MAIKTCIICGQPAGSGEHIFPSALGGRRTNKGIYCDTHNVGFSPHVATLTVQLNMFNALLMVEPDRGSSKPFIFEDTNGESLSMFGPRISPAMPPSIEDLVPTEDGIYSVGFSSMAEFHKWRKNQKVAGKDVKLVDQGTPVETFIVNPKKIRLSLGGSEGLQAIGYLGLTFLAHSFGSVARQAGLDPYKEFIEVGSKFEEGFVWWDTRDSAEVVGTNPFKFGHTVVVAVSASEGIAYGYISLFSAINFSIRFGNVAVDKDQMFTIFIDPLAIKAPDDTHTSTTINKSLKTDFDRDSLGNLISSGLAQSNLQNLLQRISEWIDETATQQVLQELGLIKMNPKNEQLDAVNALVNTLGQRIFRMLQESVEGICEQLLKLEHSEFLIQSLREIVQADTSSQTHLSPEGLSALLIAKNAYVSAFMEELESDSINPEQIDHLMSKAGGISFVTYSVIQPILLKLLKLHNQTSQ